MGFWQKRFLSIKQGLFSLLLRILSIIPRVLVISAWGVDSVPSFVYAYGISGKVCAHIYKVFIYQDNYFPNKSQKQGNKKVNRKIKLCH
jgi:hypothetical protein